MKKIARGIVLAAGLLALGCSSNERENSNPRAGPLPDCALETVIAHLTASGSATDCGHVALGSGRDVVLAANRCASEAHAAARPFWLTLEEQGTDSQISTTFVGTEIDGRFVVLQIHYDSLGMAPNGANVLWHSCTSFAVASECGPGTPVESCVSCEPDSSNFCECSPSTRQVACGLQPAQ